MPTVTIKILADAATPELARVARQMAETTPLMADAGRALVETTHRHVQDWGRGHPNKLGGRRTNHWARIAAAINPDETLAVTPTTATMTLNTADLPGISRAFGDVTITAGTQSAATYLAIPAREEAYGKRPREFDNLRFAMIESIGGKIPVLIEIEKSSFRITKTGKIGYRSGSGGQVMFWLKPQVTQPQDRSILPSEEKWGDAVTLAVKRFARRLLRGGAP